MGVFMTIGQGWLVWSQYTVCVVEGVIHAYRTGLHGWHGASILCVCIGVIFMLIGQDWLVLSLYNVCLRVSTPREQDWLAWSQYTVCMYGVFMPIGQDWLVLSQYTMFVCVCLRGYSCL